MLRTPDQIHQETDAARLDYFISRLEDSHDPQRELLLEHLTSARSFLLGAMPEEYANNLCMARDAGARLTDKRLQRDLNKTIPSLLASVAPILEQQHHRHHPRHRLDVAEPGLAQFFHGKDIAHGIFYPQKHVVAVFSSFHSAKAACVSFHEAGFGDDEVLAVEGDEVLQFLEALRAQTGLWGELMTRLSRILDTEASLVDSYERWAKKRGGFLLVYSPTETEAAEAALLVRPFRPLAAHWYMAAYIRHLV